MHSLNKILFLDIDLLMIGDRNQNICLWEAFSCMAMVIGRMMTGLEKKCRQQKTSFVKSNMKCTYKNRKFGPTPKRFSCFLSFIYKCIYTTCQPYPPSTIFLRDVFYFCLFCWVTIVQLFWLNGYGLHFVAGVGCTLDVSNLIYRDTSSLSCWWLFLEKWLKHCW